MEPTARYEILDTLASGDFATVLRARDRELGREVAIKQIHAQFLADPQQLARYWREAQLLASLQHPNILTIHDIVRPRGWLILELMQRSLKSQAQGDPLDLDALRGVLTASLGALGFLHGNGILHGDVKPGNLLLDAQNRLKLGDFGLARRATSEEGSLLRGTTKYMAPELISEQFGPVGPASDVYSLGFTAYELMCGRQFETLFPGLGTFGRDPQVAWMMWHSAADRRLPEIGRVLEGVPDDLARVIQKMVAKDPSQRYRTAEEALSDLSAKPTATDPIPQKDDAAAEAAKAAAAKKKRRLRLAAVFAVVLSGVLCAAMLLNDPTPRPKDVRGVVAEVDAPQWKLAIASSDNQRVRDLSFTRHDRFLINDQPARLEDLRADDRVVVRRVQDEALGRSVLEVAVTRPVIDSGRLVEIAQPEESDEPGDKPWAFTVELSGTEGRRVEIAVPKGVEVLFNGESEIEGRKAEPADLSVDDRLVVEHVAEGSGRRAIRVEAQRVVQETGVLCNDVAQAKDPLRVEVVSGESRQVRVFPFAPDCTVAINDRASRAPTDLRQGDRVTFDHDTRVVAVTAHRTLEDTGRVERVLADRVEVSLDGTGKPATCLIGPECALTLFDRPVALADLRRGDTLEITHDSLDRETLRPTRVAAGRPADPTRWAILVGIDNPADPSSARPTSPVADARLVQDALVHRYWVPESQALLLTDESRARLVSRISSQLDKIGPDDKLLVYVAAEAFEDAAGDVYLAPADFQPASIAQTGLRLQWLLDELESCRAGEKLWLLDGSRAGAGDNAPRQLSTAEMIESLEGPPGWAALRTVTAVASCAPGQRGVTVDEQGGGLFARSLAEAYAGDADTDRDQRVSASELMAFLRQRMTVASQSLGTVQTPVLFEADNRPPRLSEAAQIEIRRLAEHLQMDRIDFDAVEIQHALATADARGEPEPELLLGLLALKSKRRDLAREQFGELKLAHPDWLIPVRGSAWAWFEERAYSAGLAELRQLVTRIQKALPDDGQPSERHGRMLTDIGRLRQFAEIVAERGYNVPEQSLADLDSAMASLGDAAKAYYDRGRQEATAHLRDIEARAESARQSGNPATSSQLLTVERYRLESYAAFPFNAAWQEIAAGLDLRQPRY